VVLLTYRIGTWLYDRRTGLLAATSLLTMPFFFRLGTSAMLDMPVTCAFVGVLLLSLRLQERPTYLLAVALGGCLGIGLLCRYTMALVYPLVFGACLLDGQFRRLAPYLATAVLVSMGIFSCWVAWAASIGVFAAQQDKISRLAGYMNTAKGKLWLANVMLFRLPSGIGVYNAPLLMLGGWRTWRELHRSDQIVLVWIGAVCIPLLLTLPGPRYFLPAFPAFALLMARGLTSIRGGSERPLLLALLYGAGALYLFVDWYRASGGWFTH
jgi:4-amino-4-deoxy-L-arabinose transferase-like glycosyltransferase